MTLPARTIAGRTLAVSVGTALGALARWAYAAPAEDGTFPWTTFVVNVSGAALLAALPLVPAVRRVAWMPAFLGTGVLGGFTTMSAASVETFALLDHGATGTAAAYCLGTLGAALLAVLVIDRLSTASDRLAFEDREGDE